MSQTAAAAKELSYLLSEFITQAKHYLKFAYAGETVERFHTTHHPPNRLEHYGYINKLPNTTIHIQLHADATGAFNTDIFNFQHQLTKAQCEQLRIGCFRVQAKRFAGYTTLRAHQQITHLARTLHEHHGQRIVDFAADCSVIVSYSCPLGHLKLSSFFSPHTVTHNVWCRECKRAHTSTR